jgi:hypothetical protein
MGQGVKSGLYSKLLVVSAICLSNAVFADEPKHAANERAEPKSASAETNTDKSAVGTTSMFSKPVVFRGTLGDAQIQATVRPKEIIDEGLEGEYFLFGRSQKILLAGELEGDSIFLEESKNGTNISGQWEGKLQGDSIQGVWLSADGSISKPFNLKLIRPQTKLVKPKPSRKVPPTANATSSENR